jgi:hypothetical protein
MLLPFQGIFDVSFKIRIAFSMSRVSMCGSAPGSKTLRRDLICVVTWSGPMAYRNPRDLADRMASRKGAKAEDGFIRETFSQPREQARQTARRFLDRWPSAAYMSAD